MSAPPPTGGGNGLVSDILMWPLTVKQEFASGSYLPLAAGVGIPYVLMGLPSANMTLIGFAVYYALVGASVVVTKRLL